MTRHVVGITGALFGLAAGLLAIVALTAAIVHPLVAQGRAGERRMVALQQPNVWDTTATDNVGRSQAARSHLIADRMSGEATIGSEVVPPRGKERLFNGIALPAPSPFTDRAAKGAAPAGARGDRWGDTRDVAARGIGAPRPTMETLGSRSMQMEGFEDGFSHPSKRYTDRAARQQSLFETSSYRTLARASRALGCEGSSHVDQYGNQQPCATAAEQLQAEARITTATADVGTTMAGARPDYDAGLFHKAVLSSRTAADAADDDFLRMKKQPNARHEDDEASVAGATADSADDAFLAARSGSSPQRTSQAKQQGTATAGAQNEAKAAMAEPKEGRGSRPGAEEAEAKAKATTSVATLERYGRALAGKVEEQKRRIADLEASLNASEAAAGAQKGVKKGGKAWGAAVTLH